MGESAVLFVGRDPTLAPFAAALEERHPGVSLLFVGDLTCAAEVMRSVPDLVLLGAAGSPGEHAEALARARRAWGRRLPVLAVQQSTDEDDPAPWYRLGANCVLRMPDDLERARRAAEWVLTYWLDVVTLPMDGWRSR